MELSEQQQNLVDQSRDLSNLASSFFYFGDNQKALELYNQSLKLSQLNKDLSGINRALNNIASIYQQLGELQEVLNYRNLQLENSLLSGDREDRLIAYIGLTNIHADLDNLKQATKEALLSLSGAEKLGFSAKIQQGHRLLSKIYEANHDFEKALLHSQAAYKLSESISGEKVRQLGEIIRIDRQMMVTREKLKESKQRQQLLELEIAKQSNAQIFWLVSLAMVFIIGFLFYFRMIGKKEIIRQKMANLRLKEIDRIKDSILANTSHELRTPLNGIIGLSDIVLTDPEIKLDQKTSELVKLVKTSGEQLSRVINDILEMSKLKSNDITIVNSQFELTELISEVVAVCLPLADEKNLTIEYRDTNHRQQIVQDKTRLKQILFNIIGNAIKFTIKGGVIIESQTNQVHAVIEISDTGIGITEAKTERIFEGFEQVDISYARMNQGTGLGLTISRDMTVAMGGELSLSSITGKGTLVTIRLPLAESRSFNGSDQLNSPG